MPPKGPSVFLDANIVIRAGKPPGGPEIERVGDLVDAGLVKILTTDLTVTEVAKKHADNDYEVVKEIARPHFQKIIENMVGTNEGPSFREFAQTLLKAGVRINILCNGGQNSQ